MLNDRSDAYPQSAFRRSSAAHRRKALPLAMLATLCLFGLFLLLSAPRGRLEPPGTTLFTITVGKTIGAGPQDAEAEAERPGGASGSPGEPAPLPRVAPRLSPSDVPAPLVPRPALALNLIEPPIQTDRVDAPTDQLAPTLDVANDAGLSGADGVAGDAGGGAGKGSGGGEGEGIGNGRGNGGGGGGGRQIRVLMASWAPTMDHSKNYRLYPPKAREAGIEGVAILKCFVMRGDRVRGCQLLDEAPKGHGFGQAALRGQSSMRIRVHEHTGKRVYDEWVVVRKNFDIIDPPEERRPGADTDTAPGPATP